MISSQVEKVPVVCSVSVVGEVGERTLASTGGLVTSPVVFSSVDTSLTTSSPPENYKNEDNIRSVCSRTSGKKGGPFTVVFAIFGVDDPLVFRQLFCRDVVEWVFRVRRLEHCRVMLVVPL